MGGANTWVRLHEKLLLLWKGNDLKIEMVVFFDFLMMPLIFNNITRVFALNQHVTSHLQRNLLHFLTVNSFTIV